MKNIRFGISQIGKPTPRVVGIVIKVIKRISMTVAGASIIQDHPYIALVFLVIGGVADEITPLFGDNNIENNNEEDIH